MKLFLDESGNTGADLLNCDQPLFALAATNLDATEATALIDPLLYDGRVEAKYSKLKTSSKGRNKLVEFFRDERLQVRAAKFQLAHKRFWLVSHLVDKLIEPMVHESGLDLYAGDAHVGLANVWYYTGHTIFPNGMWEEVLRSFLRAIRSRTQLAFDEFDRTLSRAWDVAPADSRPFAAGLCASRGRLDEFIGVYEHVEVFDPAVDLFISMINLWMMDGPHTFNITHDRSKPLRRSERFLRTLMSPVAARKVGYGNRQAEFPLRVSDLNFCDSRDYPQLQVVDLIAGASIDCMLAWSGLRPRSDYHDAMKDTRLEELFQFGVLPSPDVSRKNDPEPGQKSIVDGTNSFLKEAGYFDKEK